MKFDFDLWILKVKLELFPPQQDKAEQEVKDQPEKQRQVQEQSATQQSEGSGKIHGQNGLSMQSGELRLRTVLSCVASDETKEYKRLR